jgi:hypothetical protein
MIRKRPELDTVNPPGQIRPSHLEKPLKDNIQDFLDSEELFSPSPPPPSRCKWCICEKGLDDNNNCSQ